MTTSVLTPESKSNNANETETFHKIGLIFFSFFSVSFALFGFDPGVKAET